MTCTASRCLKKVGQKNNADNTTNLHWKSTPMNLAEKMHPDICGSVQIYFRRKWPDFQTVGSAKKLVLVGSMVRRQPQTERFVWNCWRDHLQRFEMMNSDEQLRTVCDGRCRIHNTSLWRNVQQNWWWCEWWTWKVNRILLRIHTIWNSSKFWDENLDSKVFRIRTSSPCRTHLSSWQTVISRGPNPSTSGDNTNVWAVISRGPNRTVDEIRCRDREIVLAEADYEGMRDTNQGQPIVQLEMSDDHIPIPARKWQDIIANEFSHKYTNLRSRKLSVKWYDMKNFSRQRNRWSSSLEIGTSEAHNYVPKGRTPWINSLTQIGSILYRTEATKKDSSIVWNLEICCCTSEPSKDTQEEKRLVFHRECPFNLTYMFGCRTHRSRARRSWKQTYSTPHSSESMERQIVKKNHGDLTKARKSSSRNRVETLLRRCLLDPSWEAQKKGIAFW